MGPRLHHGPPLRLPAHARSDQWLTPGTRSRSRPVTNSPSATPALEGGSDGSFVGPHLAASAVRFPSHAGPLVGRPDSAARCLAGPGDPATACCSPAVCRALDSLATPPYESVEPGRRLDATVAPAEPHPSRRGCTASGHGSHPGSPPPDDRGRPTPAAWARDSVPGLVEIALVHPAGARRLMVQPPPLSPTTSASGPRQSPIASHPATGYSRRRRSIGRSTRTIRPPRRTPMAASPARSEERALGGHAVAAGIGRRAGPLQDERPVVVRPVPGPIGPQADKGQPCGRPAARLDRVA